jgi:hypothetical protein
MNKTEAALIEFDRAIAQGRLARDAVHSLLEEYDGEEKMFIYSTVQDMNHALGSYDEALSRLLLAQRRKASR